MRAPSPIDVMVPADPVIRNRSPPSDQQFRRRLPFVNEIFHLPTYHIPNLPTAINLRDAKIEVRWYENSRFTQMHSKLAVFDHKKVMVGSANWIHNAFRGIHEYYTEIRDTDLAGKMEAQFTEDWQKCARPVEDPTTGQRILGAAVGGASGVIF